MNDNANAVLAIGGSPLMAHRYFSTASIILFDQHANDISCINSTEEMSSIVSFINALVINIGTLSDPWIAGMHQAAETANSRNVPIVLDPVGVGATPYRMKTTMDLLNKHKIAILKGNAGEIGSIMGAEGVQSRGVDSEGDLKNPENVARELAKRLGVCVAITGPVDYISDGKTVVRCHCGNDYLGKITGTGCNTTVLVGSFAGVESDPLVAAVGGILVMGIAAELAVMAKTRDGSPKVTGPMSFKTALFDAIYHVDAATLKRHAKVEVL
jgi:hydroxyethylthiazole kinase